MAFPCFAQIKNEGGHLAGNIFIVQKSNQNKGVSLNGKERL
jgi:hypothetical protein